MKKQMPKQVRHKGLDAIDVTNKRVLVRMDLNVPMVGGRVTDNTRVVRLLPTLKELLKHKAKVIILSHLGRPKGEYTADLSLAPLVDTLGELLKGVTIKFGVDCVGDEASDAVAALKAGEVLLLENLRFHEGEEKNDPKFARALAAHGDVYVNDAFSCSHRAHASIVGINKYLPSVAGRLMEEELEKIKNFFDAPKRPFTAVIGGAKVSTKLALLESLITKVDNLIIGGAMANTFLRAKGYAVGASLVEEKLIPTAKRIMAAAEKNKCEIILPQDVVVGKTPSATLTSMVSVKDIPADAMALDIGNKTFVDIMHYLKASKTVLWNGPMGLFETRPFDISTMMIAREVAALTQSGKLKSIAGGGDTVAALAVSRLTDSFSYVSTAGGAFLEWMEGKTLPGVKALIKKGK